MNSIFPKLPKSLFDVPPFLAPLPAPTGLVFYLDYMKRPVKFARKPFGVTFLSPLTTLPPLGFVPPPAGRDIPLHIPVGTQICRFDGKTKYWESVVTTKEVTYDWNDLTKDPAPDKATPLWDHIYYFALPLSAWPFTIVAVSISEGGLFQDPMITPGITRSLSP